MKIKKFMKFSGYVRYMSECNMKHFSLSQIHFNRLKPPGTFINQNFICHGLTIACWIHYKELTSVHKCHKYNDRLIIKRGINLNLEEK